MADFQTSTHRSKWIFTPEQLAEKYKAANQQAIETLEKYGVALAKVNDDGSLTYPEIAKENADKHSRPKAVTIEEEQLMRVFYETKLQEKKAMYQQRSLSLEFDLIVYAPYRSVQGFIHDMEESCGLEDDQLPMLQTLRDTAKMDVDKIMLTDAPLLFPPGQLALAALRSANQVHKVVDFDRYLESMLSRKSSAHTISELVESLNAIDSWVRRYKFPSDKEILHINRKLKSCWGQSSRDESKKRDKKSKHKSKRGSNEAQNVT